MFGYKVFRGDFIYWIPIRNKAGAITVSVLIRLATKVMYDFTGMVHLRHPLELGGAFMSVTIFSTPFVCLYFGPRYLSFVQNNDEVAAQLPQVFSQDEVYGGIGALTALQFVSFLLFLRTINANRLKSFTSFQTGSQYVQSQFLDPKADDVLKKLVWARAECCGGYRGGGQGVD